LRIANILLEEGYLSSVTKKTKKSAHHKFIEVGIIYEASRRPRLSGLVRVSRPSRRVYSGVAELKPVNQGHGIMILSTPKGVLTDKVARKEHVGGEVICKVW
jgi:small subunit ribosomal protein S8